MSSPATHPPADGTTFSITVPASWYEVDLNPATRVEAIRRLVDVRTRGTQLWDSRRGLCEALEAYAGHAVKAGAVYAAAFSVPTEAGPITGSLMVSVVTNPISDVDGSVSDIAMGFTEIARTSDPLAPYAETSIVQIPTCGSCPRTSGIEDTRLPDGSFVRQVFMLTAVPLPVTGQVLMVAASSPVVPLVDELLDLFDAVTGTTQLLDHIDPE